MNEKQIIESDQGDVSQPIRKIDRLSQNGPLLIAYQKSTTRSAQTPPPKESDELTSLLIRLLSVN